MRLAHKLRESLAGFPPLALWILLAFAVIGVLGSYAVPHDPLKQNLLAAGQGFGWDHWLGTDHLGRDTFSRLITSARTSLVGIRLVMAIALVIGLGLGTLAGYHRGWVDEGIMRFTDVGLAMPSLIIALAMIGIFGTGYWNMIIALALAWWPAFARVSRAVATTVMNKPHIEALRVMGPARCGYTSAICCPRPPGQCWSMPRRMRAGWRFRLPRLAFWALACSRRRRNGGRCWSIACPIWKAIRAK